MEVIGLWYQRGIFISKLFPENTRLRSNMSDYNDIIDSLDTLRIEILNRCLYFLEAISRLEDRVNKLKEKWNNVYLWEWSEG